MVTKTSGKIVDIVNLTDSTKHFKIELEEELNFESGQFINLFFENNGERILKPYSIASSKKNLKEIELCINLVEGGKMTPLLFEKNIGDEIGILGPLGLMKLKGNKEKISLIGTGTGIAPLRSILKELIENNSEKEINLIFGNKFENEILYEEEFEEIEKNNPNFKFTKVISRPTENWNGRTGHVQENLEVIDPINTEFYICGLQKMVDDTKEFLINRGVNKEDIHMEKFI